jgi:hypothetical protein
MPMNGSRGFLSMMVVLCVCLTGAVGAQEEGEAAGPSVRPAEIYGCQFREGQGWSQLEHVAGRWNAWMDANDQDGYWAYLLRPLYRSQELAFDVLWAGGWANGASMAAGLESWLAEGGEVGAEFDRVVDCDTVINFAILDVVRPLEPQATGPAIFSNCTIAEGHEFTEALGAVNAWIAYEAEHGIQANNMMLFPAFGESSDSDYDFKWVTTSDWTTFGLSYDQYGTGGGWQKSRELFEGLLDCDSSRLYQSIRVRSMQMGE